MGKFPLMRTPGAIEGLRKLCRHVNSITPTKDMKLIEIGSYEGHSTKVFLNWFKKVYAIDPWKSGIGDITNVVDMDVIYERFLQRVDGIGSLKIYRGLSQDMNHRFGNGKYDIVYVDGSHKYEDTLSDIQLYLPKIKKGGWIAGHDYRKKFPGVMKAVEETIGKPDKTFPDASWLKRIEE